MRGKSLIVGFASFLSGVLLSVVLFFYWITAYTEDFDPKNIDYVLWAHGLNKNMNLDHALGGMTHDAWAVRFVYGLNKDQLKERFGRVRTLDEARPYDQLCSTQDGGVGERGVKVHGQDVLFLRDSDWMVIMEEGKAVDLVLCKGY